MPRMMAASTSLMNFPVAHLFKLSFVHDFLLSLFTVASVSLFLNTFMKTK